MTTANSAMNRPEDVLAKYLDPSMIMEEGEAELAEALRAAIAEREEKGRWATAWHGAVDTAATICELTACPTPVQFCTELRDKFAAVSQERDGARREIDQMQRARLKLVREISNLKRKAASAHDQMIAAQTRAHDLRLKAKSAERGLKGLLQRVEKAEKRAANSETGFLKQEIAYLAARISILLDAR